MMATLMGREIDRAVRHDVSTTGGVLSHLVRERGAALMSRCQILAGQPALKIYFFGKDAKDARNDWATVTSYAFDSLAQLHASAAMITDQDGRALGESGTPIADRSLRTSNAGVVSALRGESWLGVAAHDGKLTLAVSVPILEPVNHYVKGSLTAYSDIESSVALDLRKTTGSEIAFVYHGDVMGSSLPCALHFDAPREDPCVISVAGERYLVLYAPLPETPSDAGMGFVTLTPFNSAMALANRLRYLLLIISAIALTLTLASGNVVARGITRPLSGVVAAALTLQQGGWPAKLDTTRTDEIGLLQSVFNDMTTAMRASQERLLELIDKDPLTELDNHRRFQERLAQEVIRCRQSGDPLFLLLIDIDHFQQFNHHYGHAAGDEALKRVAVLIRNVAPETAAISRYGGEEFAMLLPDTTAKAAEETAERIRTTIRNGENTSELLTVSVGIAEARPDTDESEGLTLAAELAVSRAKQLGRDRICRFESALGSDEDMDPHKLHRFLKDGSIATIQALAAAVDAKDTYTQGHSARVAEYSRDLAEYIGLHNDVVELMFITGTLHDVGKIGVPDAILKKPGRLDEEERAIMETHPVLGEVIVRKAPQLASTLPGVRHHHERWDGNGYPDGLSGDSIPHMARLLALADTFDAMTSDRPYRKGMAVEIALDEIARGAGTQFDPQLAPPFVTMMSARYPNLKAA